MPQKRVFPAQVVSAANAVKAIVVGPEVTARVVATVAVRLLQLPAQLRKKLPQSDLSPTFH